MTDVVAEPGRRERKKAASRLALQDAAVRLATEVGYERLTVEAIAEAADVSPRTFFNYFSSKDEALLAPNPDVVAAIRDGILGRPAGEPPVAAIRAAFVDLAERFSERQHIWQARMVLVEQHPQLLPRMVSNFALTERNVTEAIAERMGLDADADPYPALVGAAATAALRVGLMHWRAADDRPLADLVDELFACLAAGLAAPAAPTASP